MSIIILFKCCSKCSFEQRHCAPYRSSLYFILAGLSRDCFEVVLEVFLHHSCCPNDDRDNFDVFEVPGVSEVIL